MHVGQAVASGINNTCFIKVHVVVAGSHKELDSCLSATLELIALFKGVVFPNHGDIDRGEFLIYRALHSGRSIIGVVTIALDLKDHRTVINVLKFFGDDLRHESAVGVHVPNARGLHIVVIVAGLAELEFGANLGLGIISCVDDSDSIFGRVLSSVP